MFAVASHAAGRYCGSVAVNQLSHHSVAPRCDIRRKFRPGAIALSLERSDWQGNAKRCVESHERDLLVCALLGK